VRNNMSAHDIIENVNEKLILAVNKPQSKIMQFLKIALYCIPIILTWVIVEIMRNKTKDKDNLANDKNPMVFGEKDEKNTKKVPNSDKLEKVLNSIKNDLK